MTSVTIETSHAVARATELPTSFTRNTLLSGTTTAVDALGALGLTVLIGRLLGERSTGEYGYAQTLASFALAITGLGLPSYVVQRIAMRRAEGRRWRDLPGSVLGVYLLVSLPAALLLVFGLEALLGFRLGPHAIVIPAIWSAFGISFAGVLLACFQGLSRFGPGLYAAALVRSASLIAVVVVHLLRLGLTGFFYAQAAIQTLVAGALMLGLARSAGVHVLVRPTRAWYDHVRAALPFGLSTLGEIASWRVDVLLISWLLGPRETGHYVAAYTLFMAPALFSYSAAVAFYPEAARGATAKEAVRRKRVMLRLALFIYGSIAGAALALLGPLAMRVLYGAPFEGSASLVRILAWAVPLVALNRLELVNLKGMNRPKQAFFGSVLAAGAAIAGNLLFMPGFGIRAAAWVTVATEGVFLLACTLLGFTTRSAEAENHDGGHSDV